MSICLVDTSILCELLEIPNLCKDSVGALDEMSRKVERKESLLLPMVSILETGNHIGQNGDGVLRRRTAQRFVDLIQKAIRGETPFTPTPFFELEVLLEWIAEFPDWANRGSGLGDLTILKEFQRQCALHRQRRVYVWSRDGHLSSYDRRP